MIDPLDFGKAVCEALGLDAERVARITLHIDAKDFPVARITQYVDHHGVDGVVAETRRYRLTPIEPEPQAVAE